MSMQPNTFMNKDTWIFMPVGTAKAKHGMLIDETFIHQ